MEIGKILTRVDAEAKVTGEALYPGDINLDNQLYMKTLFANRPHAIIKSIDTTEAQKIPGVVLVLTAKDVPNNAYGLGIQDQPVLCGPGSNKPFADRVRCVSDQVAIVVAESANIASKALKTISVEYESLPIIGNPDEALAEDAILIHPDRDDNVLLHYKIRDGDVERGFEASDVIVEGIYETPMQEHAYLQPEAGVSYIDENGRITVIVAGQWVHEDQEQIAHSLNLPLEKIRVIYPAIGGAFGGREDMSVQIVLALASLRLSEQGINRPVKTVWSREESIIGHHKRHAYKIIAKWGANKEGKLLAAEVKLIADAGAFAYTSTKVQGNATLMCTGPYEIPNVKVDSYTVYTNNVPGGAFRGFGGPQGAFSAEMQIDKLAEKLNLDPIEIRMRNLIREGSKLSVRSVLPKGVSLPEVVERCALEAGWKVVDGMWKNPNVKTFSVNGKVKGLGFACGYKNIGFSFGAPEGCWATIELRGGLEIEKVILIGNSAGGTVALQTALDNPNLIDGLILISPAVYGDAGAPKWIKPLLNLPQMDRLGPVLVRSIRERGLELLKIAWSDPEKLNEDDVRNYQKPLSIDRWDVGLWEFTKANGENTIAARIAEVKIPVLVISGFDDQIIPVEQSTRVASELQNAVLVVIPECGHVPQEECPEEFLNAVDTYIKNLP